MRVGLFFGTFDPLHNGHLAVAGYFLAEEYVDEVWLVPSPQNPLKDASQIAPIETRITNIQRALNAVGERRLRVCDIEAKMPTLPTLFARYANWAKSSQAQPSA